MAKAYLDARGVLFVGGADAGTFLQSLVTNDVLALHPGEACFAALLTPQGKILADFFILCQHEEGHLGYLLDCAISVLPDLVRRLSMYRLRSKITLEDRSHEFGILALWQDGDGNETGLEGVGFHDPRHLALGQRLVAPRAELKDFANGRANYQALCVRHGIPNAGQDFAFGALFPHEANMDVLHGVSFTKGCYVGQEVVSRVQHRGTARRRFISVALDGAVAQETPLLSEDGKEIGSLCASIAAGGSYRALALVRLDRLLRARQENQALHAGGRRIVALEFGLIASQYEAMVALGDAATLSDEARDAS